jgi:hypothetical protein
MMLAATTLKLTVAGALLLGATFPLKLAVSAPGHTPKINTHWNYTVRATRNGRPVAGRLTEQIVDPIGGAHPVQFGKSTKNITNWPFNGEFKVKGSEMWILVVGVRVGTSGVAVP